MDRKRAKELLPIIEAFAEGKTVQERAIGGDGVQGYDWMDVNADTQWMIDFPCYEYRIKPEPREFWVFEKPVDNGANPRHLVIWSKPVPEAKGWIKVREVIE